MFIILAYVRATREKIRDIPWTPVIGLGVGKVVVGASVPDMVP